jgi:hypothetical protein
MDAGTLYALNMGGDPMGGAKLNTSHLASYFILTEDGDYILAEDGTELLVEEIWLPD